jgi:hypothetical protein
MVMSVTQDESGLTIVVADRGYAPRISGAIFDNSAWSKACSGSNPPRQLNKTLGGSKKSGAMAEGQIILLNGTSGASKSTLVITLKFFGVIGYKFGVIR